MRTFPLGAALVLAAVCGVAARAAEAPPAPASPRLAVADIGKIYAKYDKTAAVLKTIRTRGEELQADIDVLKRELKRLQDQVQGYERGNPDRLELRAKLDKIEAQLYQRQKEANAEVDARVAKADAEIYADMLAAIADYAREKDLDLVIKQQEFALREGVPPAGTRIEMGLQTVVYCKPSLDITEAIIERLNRDYRAKAAPAGEEKKP